MPGLPRYEAVIGLEVHAQLLTKTKAFCGCSTAYGAPPNTQVCPVCLGFPGALPVLNEEAVRLAVRTALALSCAIRETSRFARKNYFYPDLPKGYQISQYEEPFSDHGHLDVDMSAPASSAGAGTRRIGITRVHMEEDAGKSVHHERASVVDLNRSGVPLVEIVGEPDLRSPSEAADYLRTLREVLVAIGVNDGNLEEGSFRCDANVNRLEGETKLGTRVELKNINSFRFVEKALAHEIARQAAVLDGGGRIVQETRGWDEDSGKTFSMRSKEEAQDYRYFPDPDLPPLVLDHAFVQAVQSALPELPRAKRERFVRELGLSPYAAGVLTGHPGVAAFFEQAAALHGNAVKVANFVQAEVLRDAAVHGVEARFPVTPAQVAGLLKLVDSGAMSGKQAKEVFGKMAGTSLSPEDVVAQLWIQQVSDQGAIEAACRRVVDANPKQAEQLRAGKTSLMGYFVGQVMKETKGSANPQMVNEALKRILGYSKSQVSIAARSRSSPAPPPAHKVGARVLIVDDNVELVGTLHAILMTAELHDGASARALEVIAASRGDEGLAIARSRGFDVAIVDVKLPDASGVDLIPRLREAAPFGEVVLITGFASMDAAIGALRSNAFAFVPKSFRPEELLTTIEQALTKVRLAREREELERRYRALVELTDVLVVGLDAEDRVALFNRKAAMFVNVDAADAIGRAFLESWIPEADRIRMREAIALARVERATEVETGFHDLAAPATPVISSRDSTRASSRARIRWHLSMAREAGDVTYDAAVVYGIGIDVTERRALEKRAADAEALSAMGTLALNLAHEIRNPLNAAVLQLHLLGRHVAKLAVDDEIRAALHHKAQIVGDEIGRLNRLLTDFLELARPRAAVHEPVHFARLIGDVLDLEQGSAADRGVTVERDLVGDCVLKADPEKLKQVVLNLVMNALEAMKGGGKLLVRVACDAEKVRLVVEDTGSGIEPGALSQVFDPFFTTKEAGTGLGLSIVRKIVDQHRGEVRIESDRGVGTKVTVTLPR